MVPARDNTFSPADSSATAGFVTRLHTGQLDLTTLVYLTFAVLSLLSAALHLLARRTRAQTTSAGNPHFVRFQRQFFLVYFLALLADWLQGPYVYKLYSHYGFAERQIAVIYVVGFAASVLFGTATGPLADRFGRRRMCLAFCAAYTVCCLTKLSASYTLLLVGRVFGGVATSMLFSTFESWYVHEHVQRHDFPSAWLSVTFSQATFGNGLLAIGAGVVANAGAEWLQWGPVAPFVLAVPCLVACAWLVARHWPENYGDRSAPVASACWAGARTICEQRVILLLGVVQALFEAAMYVFVFLWTPLLEPARPPLGIVFSTFMVCIMLGSSLYTLLVARGATASGVLAAAVALHMVAAAAAGWAALSPPLAFAAFICLEVSVGLYFPAVGYLRSQVIPEHRRAAIMNWFRVPMNALTCAALLWLHNEPPAEGATSSGVTGNQTMFVCCSLMLAVALAASVQFSRALNSGQAEGTQLASRPDGCHQTDSSDKSSTV